MNINFLPKNLLSDLEEKSKNSSEEICGFVIDNEFMQVKNSHPDPQNYFLISPKECVWQKDAILFHSHPIHANTKGFSNWDIENQKCSQFKMLLYSVKYNEFYYREP